MHLKQTPQLRSVDRALRSRAKFVKLCYRGLIATSDRSHDGDKGYVAWTGVRNYIGSIRCASTNNKLGGDSKV